MSQVYSLKLNHVGLIVRGKHSHDHNPGKMEQHADCILPGGQPVGFFGNGGDASSGVSGPSFGSSSNSWAAGPSAIWNSKGLNMKGMVAYIEDLRKIRPMYVDAALAKKYDIKSTVLLLEVTKDQADLFKRYWTQLKLNPGAFNILGGNCSTHASEAFIDAKILTKGIPGLDTPNNLYKQLSEKYIGRCQTFSGYIGVRNKGRDLYDLVVE